MRRARAEHAPACPYGHEAVQPGWLHYPFACPADLTDRKGPRLTFYLHVGASKTASTTLQGRFFPAHPGIFFLGKEESTIDLIKRWASPEIFTVVNDIDRRTLDFHPDAATVKATLD